VRVRIASQRPIYQLDPDGLLELEQWLARSRKFWAIRLQDRRPEIRSNDSQNTSPSAFLSVSNPDRGKLRARE
jgi:hypothetical protein